MSFILLVVAIFLFVCVMPLAVAHFIIDLFRYGSAKQRMFGAALGIDIAANSLFSSFLNAYFLKKGGYHFGMPGETISSALGKNQVSGTLTIVGLGLVKLLNVLDRDHCWKSISGTDMHYYLLQPKPQDPSWVYFFAFLFAAVGLITAGGFIVIRL